jgi:hypothetical protein
MSTGRVANRAARAEVGSDPLPGAPVIEVHARAVLGSVTVKQALLTHRISALPQA